MKMGVTLTTFSAAGGLFFIRFVLFFIRFCSIFFCNSGYHADSFDTHKSTLQQNKKILFPLAIFGPSMGLGCRTWVFEIDSKVGYGVYVYDSQDISKLIFSKI